MSHRIDYSSRNLLRKKRLYYFRLPLLMVFCFFIFLIQVYFLWPAGKDFLLEMLSSRTEVAVFSALDIAAEELGGGRTLLEVFRTLREAFP